MKRSLVLLLALALASCKRGEEPAVPEGPVEWTVSASADKSQVQVGEDLTLTLVLRHPKGGRYVAPPDTAFAPFDVIEKTEESVSPVETRLHYRLAAFRLPGEVEIPALLVQYQKDGKVESLATDAIPVKILTSLTPDVTEIHDIKDPVDLEVPRDFRMLWWILLALGAAVLAYLIYRKLRKEPEGVKAPAMAPPLPPPDVEAEAALRRLMEKDLIRKGEISAFYTELSEVMKRYAGRRFEVPYLERTT
ncbi:MAG TPA: BatD family protein, partial [Vicinamibacteria bacterium]